ncbi:hypothetical protein [Streptomyces sp. NPDC058653]|uniref:hypothetical protein n=1 Tax=Streptomyces sp. NPDC058653 TaxID=3346576 RepID=UPI00364AF674
MSVTVVLFTSDPRLHDHPAPHAAPTRADEVVHMAGGVTGYADRRERQLHEHLRGGGAASRVHGTVITAVAPGAVKPSGSDHYSVLTPCFHRWSGERLREILPAPRNVSVPEGVSGEPLPCRDAQRAGLSTYAERHDDLGGDASSRPSLYPHFGTRGKRFDPQGVHVRRPVPEPRDVDDRRVYQPWPLPEDPRARIDHPEPLIDLADGPARFKRACGRD